MAGKYEPSMEPIRNGRREFVLLDQLHLENLHATFAEFSLNAADFDNRDLADLNAAWERLDPWEDSVAGLAELGRHVIVGPLSNANLALLLRMALRSKLPWTVDRRLGCDPGLQTDPGGVSEHGVDAAAGSRRGHARGGPQPRSDVCATAFIPRPNELGPGQTKDLTAEGDWEPRLRKHPQPRWQVHRCLKPHTPSAVHPCRSLPI